MISISDRKGAHVLIEEAVDSGSRKQPACNEIGISLRTLQRWKDVDGSINEDKRPLAVRPEPANKLTKEEKDIIIETVNSSEYESMPPSQIVPDLADQGRYIASESTMYRVMHEEKQQNHRGRAKSPVKRPISTHVATGPNQVWCWDITWLPGPVKGMYFYLYLMLDLFSRKVVGWEIYDEESSENASQLIRKACLKEQTIQGGSLVLHSDNGSPMKGSTFLETMRNLGITPSRSRPRVSNDNAFAESFFRTCKYRPGFPFKGFSTIEDSRKWIGGFIQWYNFKHHHSRIKFVTPDQRHTGEDEQILRNRRKVYLRARLKNPQRWSKSIRNWDKIMEVTLNPVKQIRNSNNVA